MLNVQGIFASSKEWMVRVSGGEVNRRAERLGKCLLKIEDRASSASKAYTGSDVKGIEVPGENLGEWYGWY